MVPSPSAVLPCGGGSGTALCHLLPHALLTSLCFSGAKQRGDRVGNRFEETCSCCPCTRGKGFFNKLRFDSCPRWDVLTLAQQMAASGKEKNSFLSKTCRRTLSMGLTFLPPGSYRLPAAAPPTPEEMWARELIPRFPHTSK